MILQALWQRLRQNWRAFATMSLWQLVLDVIFGVVVVIMAVVAILSVGPSLGLGKAFAVAPNPVKVFATSLVFLAAAVPLSLAYMGFSFGGVVGAVAAERRGERITLGSIWSNARRHFWRYVGLTILLGLTSLGVALVVLALPMILIGLPTIISGAKGSAASGILLIVLMLPMMILWLLVMGLLIINIGIYPCYLIAADGLPVGEAYGRGWRALTGRFGEAVRGALVWLAYMICLLIVEAILSGLSRHLPVAQQLLSMALSLVTGPLVIWYYAERFEQNVRPYLWPQDEPPQDEPPQDEPPQDEPPDPLQ